MPPTVAQIAASLAAKTDADRLFREGDPVGVWLDSPRPVRRLGLRLEAGRAPYAWADGLDAVLLHRPFGLWPARLPDGLGVLAYHRALDERFAVGHNPALARELGLEPEAEPLMRGGNVVGLVGALPAPLTAADVLGRVADVLGGVEETAGAGGADAGGAVEVSRVALVGAMTEALVEAAAERGVGVYVTGQVRRPGVAPAEAAGVLVAAVGQERAERWGLRHLGRLVAARWPDVDVVDAGGEGRG
ncbi:Nif3-like dinuclear metal center hexameric protein [Rubrivirga sp. S365]|uniref:Nif3-like dinuclear metal center hexameric protein n=1 Tax=Rubrivirga litoralis TaxID=3075598 RepID=A0ABU3BQ12_9BACT|nr:MULTISPECIES: Nif3-like dinuclear metal center hexameric protein [unclassified Rubrivirga]MDT0631353.1 Nif3-like dinuclear metal center hexameric protein [Rubrivirga sp. F394]MDT7855944.1 Nif3-like dinuclear metal center hexameric protein [Rubrivirga sp. S365]